MQERINVIRAVEYGVRASAFALAQLIVSPSNAADEAAATTGVVVSVSRLQPGEKSGTKLEVRDFAARRLATPDASRFLLDVPGLALSGAGALSSLPVIHGLADDRNRITVDGMDLISSCGNHMNPPLSYVDPARIDSIVVYSGVTPVSAGADSIGGTIVVRSAPPRFADSSQTPLLAGELGASYRSNAHARSLSASVTLAGENASLTYRSSTARADNYTAAKPFKPSTIARWTAAGDHRIAGDEVGSSAYRMQSETLGIALRGNDRMVTVDAGVQRVPYQGFPNQYMDMVDNDSKHVNVTYSGDHEWGRLEGRIYHEETRHRMDFGDDKLYWYGMAHDVAGMPMHTHGRTLGARLAADIALRESDILKLGSEYRRYRLDDRWPPVAHSMMMSPDTFWNIRDGQRDRFDVFAEWQARWSDRWETIAGLRSSTVRMNAGQVQGYNANPMMYGNDAARFNARDRSVTDHNVDAAVIARHSPDATRTYEAGFARKTRSPSLYERYTWSTNAMAMAMNNWVNDGNGYVGNVALKPEVANSLSLSVDLHDSEQSDWQLKVVTWYTHVDDYIDARCLTSCAVKRFNYLELVNRAARLYGVDASGFAELGSIAGAGSFAGRIFVAYVNGRDTSSGDGLYNIMPLNARLTLEHRLARWTTSAELVLVAAKNALSRVRNEIGTAGYGLLNLRTSYAAKHFRVDLGIDNVFDRLYAQPLGGAYVGQGATMSLNGSGAPYGIAVPAMGRSIYVASSISF